MDPAGRGSVCFCALFYEEGKRRFINLSSSLTWSPNAVVFCSSLKIRALMSGSTDWDWQLWDGVSRLLSICPICFASWDDLWLVSFESLQPELSGLLPWSFFKNRTLPTKSDCLTIITMSMVLIFFWQSKQRARLVLWLTPVLYPLHKGHKKAKRPARVSQGTCNALINASMPISFRST